MSIGKKYFCFFILIGLVLSGCVRITADGPKDGSPILKSFNRGNSWTETNTVVNTEGTTKLLGANVKKLVIDPQDNSAIYAATEDRGLFYTFNAGQFWMQPQNLQDGSVNDVAVDPNNKCRVIAAYGHKIMETLDCNRSWRDVYIDKRPEIVYSLAISKDGKTIYFGTGFGEVVSLNSKGEWAVLHRFNNKISGIYISDENKIFALVSNTAIYESAPPHGSWKNITPPESQFKNIMEGANAYLGGKDENILYITSKYGIVKLSDNGAWTEISPPMSIGERVEAFSPHPNNSNEMYALTLNSLLISINNGDTWEQKRMSISGKPSFLLIDPVNPSIFYLGTRSL